MDGYLRILKENGLKITPKRKFIIDLFLGLQSNLSAEEVWSHLAKQFKKCGLPSVYRNLEDFVNCGILTRIQKFDRKKYYALCTAHSHHHHHIVCIKCGKVDVINECGFSNKRKIKGYKIISHFMQINGVCSSCAKVA